jgi:hypothetical protein
MAKKKPLTTKIFTMLKTSEKKSSSNNFFSIKKLKKLKLKKKIRF